jgi:hypothetical protein
MAGFDGAWFLCGGWAVDAWLGRQSREHHDIDIAVFEDDLPALFDQLAGWQLIAHDTVESDAEDPWDGRRLILPAHIHARREGEVELDFQVNQRSGSDWVLSQERNFTIDVQRCAGMSRWGVPALAPELVLFYKAGETRPQDEQDFVAMLGSLDAAQRSWLRGAIATVHPGHAWLAQLSP